MNTPFCICDYALKILPTNVRKTNLENDSIGHFCSSNSYDSSSTLQQYDSTVQPKKKVNLIKAKKNSKNLTDGTYSMESENNRGVLFIANNVNFETENKRNGADEDAYALMSLFKQMKFKLHAYKDPSRQQFFQKLDKLLCCEEVRNTNSFIMALMSHGINRDGTQWIKFKDGSIANFDDILQRFSDENCPYLIGKPKIFIVPVCRGERQEGSTELNIETEMCTIQPPHLINGQMSDVIICYATRKGYAAFRDTDKGSWYIQKFVETMAEYAHIKSFIEILDITNERVSQMRTELDEFQTPNYEKIGFNKTLLF